MQRRNFLTSAAAVVPFALTETFASALQSETARALRRKFLT